LIRQGAPREILGLTAEHLGMMSSGEQLVIEGRLGGRLVGATWADGDVVGDAALIHAARVVVADVLTVDQDGTVYTASFRTVQGAAVALMRALDDIESVRISAPAEDPLFFGGTPLSNDPRG
jgi:hypothetical protein